MMKHEMGEKESKEKAQTSAQWLTLLESIVQLEGQTPKQIATDINKIVVFDAYDYLGTIQIVPTIMSADCKHSSAHCGNTDAA